MGDRPFPGPTGREHLRIMQRAANDPTGAVVELHARYGRAFAFGFGSIRSHWLIGEAANAFMLAERADHFRQRGAYPFLEPIGGPDALISSDGPRHLQRRRTVQSAFHHRQVQRWTDEIAGRFDVFYANAGDEVFDIHDRLRSLVLALMLDLLLGRRDGAERDAWAADIAAMMAFANLPLPLQLVRLPLPGLPWRAFAAARARTDRRLAVEISRRRGSGDHGDDVLGLLLAAGTDDDRSLRDQALSLVSAAFDTTSAALAWTLYLLGNHPDTASELAGEFGGGVPLATALASPRLERVLAESLRLYPAAAAGLRRVVRPLVFDGYRLPAGALAGFSIYLTHRDPAVFAEPDRFLPDRWLGAAVSPFAYLPFGYGARHCIGAPLAKTVIKVALIALLRGFRIEPGWREPIASHGTTLQPLGGVPLRLVPR